MKFFYADSLDLVDPVFDFEAEKSRNPKRVPQRDDVYAHELMEGERPYDGLLVSKALFRVGGGSVATGKYSQAQRKRFEREGAPRFLRFPKAGRPDPERFPILGDCGAFAYIEEPEPPLDVDELIVAEAWVGKNMTMKRGRPRARGRFGKILKPFAEITIKVRQVEEQA